MRMRPAALPPMIASPFGLRRNSDAEEEPSPLPVSESSSTSSPSRRLRRLLGVGAERSVSMRGRTANLFFGSGIGSEVTGIGVLTTGGS